MRTNTEYRISSVTLLDQGVIMLCDRVQANVLMNTRDQLSQSSNHPQIEHLHTRAVQDSSSLFNLDTIWQLCSLCSSRIPHLMLSISLSLD